MSEARIRDLFASDVTRDIPPVVYFHEQSPDKLAAEVSEYIITGGWPDGHPNKTRVGDGIHEQYVRLLNAIADALESGSTDLPNAWISGFYGSGKSSFAKLLGLALDGVALPGDIALAEAWLKRDTSPRSAELHEAWRRLSQRVDPLAVVFDIGSVARDGEHIHAATVRQVQHRLGYCSTEPLVADFELSLERDGQYDRFLQVARDVLGEPWGAVKDRALAEEEFSHVLSVMFPERYVEPMSWFLSRGGTHRRAESPEEAVRAIRDMLQFRKPNATLFLVIDEVSQFVLSSGDRVDRMRAFVTALGATFRGKAWLFALGQQKLDEQADAEFLVWAKDRFPPKLRVHLAPGNIRDVVHKRLLRKTPAGDATLRDLFAAHGPDLRLFAYGCEDATAADFAEVYPLLPGQIDLILELTSALRLRSSRAQGDDQAIRGLLQLLGELFRHHALADGDVGTLVSLDKVYDVQHTALDADVQNSMARILSQCAEDDDPLPVRAAKAVALLELIQDDRPTTAELVARCLYDRVDRGNNRAAVTDALEDLRRRNLLGYSEKHGYKLQSSAGEEWERERRDIGAGREVLSKLVQDGLKHLLEGPDRPQLDGRPFPWAAVFSDGRYADDASLLDPRDDANVRVDLRYLARDERAEAVWVRRSGEDTFRDRLIWVAGDIESLEHEARELYRSQAMVRKYHPRRDSLGTARRVLLHQEQSRAEELDRRVRDAIAAAWMAGALYFRGRRTAPGDVGGSFAVVLNAVGNRILPDLYPSFVSIQLQPSELMQLLDSELSGPSPKLMDGQLGILEVDAGRFVPRCAGVVPARVRDHIRAEQGVTGARLLAHFGAPPYGYVTNVVKACVAGLLRASLVKIQPGSGDEITSFRDAGVRDVFDKDRDFRRALIFDAGDDEVGFTVRARLCKMFEQRLGHTMDREDHAIADAVARYFPAESERLRSVLRRLDQLPGPPDVPPDLKKLSEALEACVRTCRQTLPTVKLVHTYYDVLNAGLQTLRLYDTELTDDAMAQVRQARRLLDFEAAQLVRTGVESTNVLDAVTQIEAQLGAALPWREMAGLADAMQAVRDAYVAERKRLLVWQEDLANEARSRVRGRHGFATRTADQQYAVLRPISEVVSDTTADAIAPSLNELKVDFIVALARAEEQANDRLDDLLSEQQLVKRVTLNLQGREVGTPAEVDALVEEVRARLIEEVGSGARVRIA